MNRKHVLTDWGTACAGAAVFIACSCLPVQSRPELRLLLHPSSSAQGWMNALKYPRCVSALPSHAFNSLFSTPDILCCFTRSENPPQKNKTFLSIFFHLFWICVSLLLSSATTTNLTWLIAKGQGICGSKSRTWWSWWSVNLSEVFTPLS